MKSNDKISTALSVDDMKPSPMHPVLLHFRDPAVEQEFQSRFGATCETMYIVCTLCMFGLCIIMSGDKMMNEYVTWRSIHVAQLIGYLLLSKVPPSFRFPLIAIDVTIENLSAGAMHLVECECAHVVCMMFSWFVVSSQHSFRAAVPLLFVKISLIFFLFVIRGKLIEFSFVNLFGVLTCWLHERVARCTLHKGMLEKESETLWLKKLAESEITHLQGIFLSQIGALTNDPRVHTLLRRAKNWVNSQHALTDLRSGTYEPRRTRVHMPTLLRDMDFEIVHCVEYVEVDELLFAMCCEQARANAAKYAQGQARVRQTLQDGLLITEYQSTNAEGVLPIPKNHDFFSYGTTTKGTGIGLSTVKLACEITRGWCALEAVDDNQTRLSVALPAQLAENPAETQATMPRSTVVIDDEPMITMIMASTLASRVPSMRVTELGGTPEERGSLECVCDLALKAEPQLIVCDNYLDELSGIDVARALQDRGYSGVFILQTCCSDEEKKALEKEHVLTIDAVVQKRLQASEEVLTEYDRIVRLAKVASAACPALDIEQMDALVAEGDTAQLIEEAKWLAETHDGESRLKAVARLLVAQPDKETVCAFLQMVRQVLSLSEESGSCG